MIDTAAEIEEVYRAKLLSLSGEERLLRAARMFDAARDMVLASLPPGMEEADIRVALLKRFYGNDLDDSELRVAEEAIRARSRWDRRYDGERKTAKARRSPGGTPEERENAESCTGPGSPDTRLWVTQPPG